MKERRMRDTRTPNPANRGLEIPTYEDAVEVLGQAYQLISQFAGTGVVPDLDKWLDHLAAGRLLHPDLMPVNISLPI
jgi:hypothetical protein